MKTYNTILQYFWLVVGILTGIYALFTYFTFEGEIDPILFVMPILAFGLFFMRRWYNNKMKKASKEKED